MKNSKRLYISADIEGVAGIVSIEQLTPSGFEYAQACEWMTGEVAAACRGAFNSGIDEIVISDSHGNGQNLLLDRLPSKVQVVRSWPRPLCMMEGIDVGRYVGAVLLGYHGGCTERKGVLTHTLSGRGISEVRLNGQIASETFISTATAGHFGVPVVMISGDDAYIKHSQDALKPVETVTTKWASSFTSARMLLPKESQQRIFEGVNAALARLHEFQPKRLPDGIKLDVTCVKSKSAELLSYLPIVDRLDSHRVRFIGHDMVAISKFLSFLLSSGVLTFD